MRVQVALVIMLTMQKRGFVLLIMEAEHINLALFIKTDMVAVQT